MEAKGMSKIRVSLKAAVLGFVVVAGGLVSAPAAYAGGAGGLAGAPAAYGGCNYGAGQELCGRVINDSGHWVEIAEDWCGGVTSGGPCSDTDKRRLNPGGLSTDYFRDTDGLYIPNGCVAFTTHTGRPVLSSGWHKIFNNIGYQRVVGMSC